MKKGAAFVLPLLVVFLYPFASCSYAPSDPTPYIPQEYRDAFLCSGSFTLGETKEAAPEEGRCSPSLPQVLSASYRVRRGNAFYDIRYREGENPSAEPVSVSLSSPVTAPSELFLEEIPSLLKTIWELSKASENRERIFVSFSSAGNSSTISQTRGFPAMCILCRKKRFSPFPALMRAIVLWEPALYHLRIPEPFSIFL